MLLLSQAGVGQFTESEQNVLRTIATTGAAVIKTELKGSAVQGTARILRNERLQAALDGADAPVDQNADADGVVESAPSLPDMLAEVAEQVRLQTASNLSVALYDHQLRVLGTNGVAAAELRDLLRDPAMRTHLDRGGGPYAVNVRNRVFAAYVTEADAKGRRLLAIDAVPIGGASLVRQVLGNDYVAAVVDGNLLLGDVLGDMPAQDTLLAIAQKHSDLQPGQATAPIRVEEGGVARLAIAVRPEGLEPLSPTFVALSKKALSIEHRDLAQALREASSQTSLSTVSWIVLGLLLLLSAGLAYFLPQLEAVGPMRRLAGELVAVAHGQLRSVFAERYSGHAAQVAQAASTALDSLRRSAGHGGYDEGSQVMSTHTPGRLTRTPSQDDAPSVSGRREIALPHIDDGGSQDVEVRRVSLKPTAAPTWPPLPSDEISLSTTLPPTATDPGYAQRQQTISTGPPAGARNPAPRAAVDPRSSAGGGGGEHRHLYDQFLQVKEACGESTTGLTYDRFVGRVHKNTEALLSKRPDAQDVQFSVYVKDGKAALKAKIIKRA